MKHYLLLFSLCIISCSAVSQNTIGLLSYIPNKTQDGYLFLYPQNQGTAFLLNNCGEVVHKWTDDPTGPSNAGIIAEDGTLYMAKMDYNYSNPWMYGGGGGQRIERRGWDNELLWTYTYADSLHRMHHNFVLLPNGNVVIIAWERRTLQQCIDAGKDTTMMIDQEIWPDHLIEVQPTGLNTGTIVWEWHAWDHLVQDFDPGKANFGVVADHPELININYINGNENADWIHFNSVDYNPVLDQLIVSTPTLNEVWIIDHSTTTAQASGHTGGLSGKGGDLIYRWGNPAAYNQGSNSDRKLGFQHDIHWTDLELPNGHPDKGKLMVFNNRASPNVSEAATFQPVFDTVNHVYLMQNNTYLPVDFDYTYSTPDPADMFCAVVSSAQRLPNGNTLICSGRLGYTLEVDTSDLIVWEYKTPLLNSVPAPQGTQIPLGGNFTFRSKKYTANYAGFAGKNLTPEGYIELNPDTTFCPTILTAPTTALSHISIFPNPATEQLQVAGIPENTSGKLTLVAPNGETVLQQLFENEKSVNLNLENLESGVYFIFVEIAGTHLLITRVTKV